MFNCFSWSWPSWKDGWAPVLPPLRHWIVILWNFLDLVILYALLLWNLDNTSTQPFLGIGKGDDGNVHVMYALAWMCSADAAYLYTYLHFALHLQCNYQGLGCVSPSFNALIFLTRPYYRPTSELLTLIFIELVGNAVRRSSTGSLILSRRYITSSWGKISTSSLPTFQWGSGYIIVFSFGIPLHTSFDHDRPGLFSLTRSHSSSEIVSCTCSTRGGRGWFIPKRAVPPGSNQWEVVTVGKNDIRQQICHKVLWFCKAPKWFDCGFDGSVSLKVWWLLVVSLYSCIKHLDSSLVHWLAGFQKMTECLNDRESSWS